MHGASAKQSDIKEFSGQLYIEIPASERYENNFAKKAKKMAKEEMETKKQVSIKNGKEFNIMTPMVKIKHECDLEYSLDDEEEVE